MIFFFFFGWQRNQNIFVRISADWESNPYDIIGAGSSGGSGEPVRLPRRSWSKGAKSLNYG